MVKIVQHALRIAAVACVITTPFFRGDGMARAEDAVTVQLSIKNHRFIPAEITAPAGKPIMLRIKNLDSTPAEFESVTLRVEKVIAGNSEGVIRLRALEPGRYKFVDDFNKETTQGTLLVSPR